MFSQNHYYLGSFLACITFIFSVFDQEGKSYNIKTVSRFVLSIQACYKVNSDVFSISLLFRFVSILNQFHVPLFMINKVNVALLRQFLDLYCLSMLIIRFHTMFSQYHYYLGSFQA